VGYRTESMHGAGSPQAQRIMIARQGNLEQKKALAKKIAGIPRRRYLSDIRKNPPLSPFCKGDDGDLDGPTKR